MYINTCIYIHTRVYICIHICICTCVCVYMYVYVHMECNVVRGLHLLMHPHTLFFYNIVDWYEDDAQLILIWGLTVWVPIGYICTLVIVVVSY